MPFVTVNGVGVSYGPVKATSPFAKVDMKDGDTTVRRLSISFTFDDLPVGGTGRNVSSGPIPTGSLIVDAYWQTKVAFAGGTSYDVGLEDVDGNAHNEDAGKDSLFDALALAQINAVNETTAASVHNGTNSGVLTLRQVDKAAAAGTTYLTEDGYVVVTATGTFTAGKAVLIVEYIPPNN